MNARAIVATTIIAMALIACSPKSVIVTPSVTPSPLEYIVHAHGYDRALAKLQYSPVILAASISSLTRITELLTGMSSGSSAQEADAQYSDMDDDVRTELQSAIGDGIEVAFLVTKQGMVWTGYDRSAPESWVPASDLMFDTTDTEETQFWTYKGRLLMVRNVFAEDGTVVGMVGITVGPVITSVEH